MRIFFSTQHLGKASPKPKRVLLVTALLCFLCQRGVMAQESANADLDQCMKAAAAQGAVAGAIVGGIFGAIVGGDSRNRDRNAIAGAAAGAAAGGFLAWRNSWATCSSKFVKAESVKTSDHVITSKRVGYNNQGIYGKITGTRVRPFPEVRGGQSMELSVQYDILSPDGRDVEATILREIFCKDDNGSFVQVVSFPERRIVQSGQQVSKGEIRIPSLPQGSSAQECQVNLKLQAQGVEDSKGGRFVIKAI